MKLPVYLTVVILLAVAPSAAGQSPASAPSGSGDSANGLSLSTGDVVVFVGDELTEVPDGRGGTPASYPLLVESFLSVRYPDLRVRYINAGWGGDTAGRTLLRLERDVLVHKPTVVVICLGLNDPGYLGFDPNRLEAFRKDLSQIIERCREAGTRVWLISPPSVDVDRGRKVTAIRDGRRVVVDLRAIDYDQTLGRYASAMAQIAGEKAVGFVDWYVESTMARSRVPHTRGITGFTRDGRLPTTRSLALVASSLLRAMGAQPIRVSIDLDWQGASAEVASRLAPAVSIPIEMTEDGKRILTIKNLPLPWPMPIDRQGGMDEDWQAVSMCEFVFKMTNPPPLGIMLGQETTEPGHTGGWPIASSQLEKGFNLTLAEPLRSLPGVQELSRLIETKNGTRHMAWRRLELSSPQEPELADAHRQLIRAWTSYVAGYEELIFKFPKTFDAKFTLTETTSGEHLPTSRPVPRPGTRTTRPASPITPAK